ADGLGGRVILNGSHVAVAGRQHVPAREPRGRRHTRGGDLQKRLALAVELDDLVAIGLRHEHLAARYAVDAAGPAGAAVRWEALQLLALGVQPHAVALP